MLDYGFDASFLEKGYRVVCGVDEAGRGPLCGPVVAAACVLPYDCVIEGLDDSKKLTEKKREKLFCEITEKALAYGIAEASPLEIDEINILNASLLAMRRAIEMLGEEYAPDLVLVDGNQTKGFTQNALSVVHGDAVSQSIAAASVLAKVTRDRMCADLEEKYPGYGIGGHKGYPTKAHKLAVYRLGPSPCHRKSFLAFLERDKEKLAAWDAEEKLKSNG
ncbi:MAG: ribonuclease HII [Ruminococcaceae bacterium]|nr:ribonuclease HII [Oscillospiraceae bacterium]